MLLTAFVYYRVRCLLFILLCCIANEYLSSYNTEKNSLFKKKLLQTENILGKNI